MPRAVREPIEEFLIDLEEHGLELPDGLPFEVAYRLAGASAFFARRNKKVEMVSASRLIVRDSKVEVEVVLEELTGPGQLPAALAAHAPAARAAERRTVIWLDATATADPEWRFEHALWGEITLYRFPTKPRRPTDERVLAAERAGWGGVLKTFNVLPARGIVVEDGRHGLLVTSPDAAAFSGIAVHSPSGEMAYYPNAFVEARRNDPEFQYWLQWGEGMAESEWRRVAGKGGEG